MDIKIRSGWVVMVLASAAIKIFSFFPYAVEKYYAQGIYPIFSWLLRWLFGWIPFSVGDIFYCGTAIYFGYKLYSFLRRLFKNQLNRKYLIACGRQLILAGLFIYLIFNLFWGLNYNRQGIAFQLGLDVQRYTATDLKTVIGILVDKLNSLDSAARRNRCQLNSKRELFRLSVQSYQSLAKENKIFEYSAPSVKPSLFSYLGNYLGFTGYYNPFSGEAQVNTTVPLFIQPFTTCHEIGHQLGYAKENEANFSGYLSAKSSTDPAFRYSVYFELYAYAASELYFRDSTLLKPLREKLNPGIRNDFKELQRFLTKYNNPFEPYVRRLYGRYLRVNEQPKGIKSYNEVIAWLIAYYKKYGPGAI